jgi:tetratricopeptide (TPR) repeat protein
LLERFVVNAETTTVKAGRNDPCLCGSGKKYKACCGQIGTSTEARKPMDELVLLAALMDAGRYAQLETDARALLGAWPQSGFIWQLLGVALVKQGKDALHALERAAQLMPDDAVAHLNLGNALGRLGRLGEAQESFKTALAIHPELAEAHNNLADVQLELGRFDEATLSCRRAIDINPGFAEAHQNLGKALTAMGHLDDAVNSCRLALEIRPRFAEAHNTLGNVLLRLSRLDDAIANFRRAVAISPEFVLAHINLANALRSRGQLEEAVASYRRALSIQPDFAEAHTELGTALRLQRRTAESEASCREALRIAPDLPAALAVLADLQADAGRFTEAEELFKRVIAIDPEFSDAWIGLARLRPMTVADKDWLAAAQRLAEKALSAPREMSLRFAIGKYFDDVKDFENAFVNFRRANELSKLSGPAYDRRQLTQTIDLIIRSHDRAWISRAGEFGNSSDRPVFIVGMLRSGTTLTEQILASHPTVFGAGELTFWGTALAPYFTHALAVSTPTMEMNNARVSELGHDYLEMLERLSSDAARVVDKFPTNFLLLGLIHVALPHARIIHMRRNPIDTCLSIYFQHLEAANTYANDLDDLAHYYSEYRRLMRHWRSVLPAGAMLEVPYEGLVQDLPAWSRRMLDFIGLPWDPGCLEFHQSARAVVTASRWQVRQKISTSSVERWRNYERFVGPLKSLLDSSSSNAQ